MAPLMDWQVYRRKNLFKVDRLVTDGCGEEHAGASVKPLREG